MEKKVNNKIEKLIHTVFLAIVLSVLNGCTIFAGMPDPPRTSTNVKPNADYLLGLDAVRLYNLESEPQKKTVLRNELIDARMAEIDRQFREFERKLYTEGIGYGVGTEWTLLGLSAASTVSRVINTKTAISAVATAVSGGTNAFSKETMFDKTMPALMAQMQAEREKMRAFIRVKQTSPADKYSWYAAESDLFQFEFAGSIPGAISAISKDAGVKNVESQKIMEGLTRGSYSSSESGSLLRAFWKPDGILSQENEGELKAWMKKNNFDIGPGAVTMFLSSDEQEEARQKAVKELKLPRK